MITSSYPRLEKIMGDREETTKHINYVKIIFTLVRVKRELCLFLDFFLLLIL